MCRDVSNMNVNDEEEVRFLVMYEDLHGLNAWKWKVRCFPTAGLRIVTSPCRSLEIKFHLLRLIIHCCSVEQLWKHLIYLCIGRNLVAFLGNGVISS